MLLFSCHFGRSICNFKLLFLFLSLLYMKLLLFVSLYLYYELQYSIYKKFTVVKNLIEFVKYYGPIMD